MNEHIILDADAFKRLLLGGARELRANVSAINDLNVFPVPDGDTGTNMARTVDGGVSEIAKCEACGVGEAAAAFAKGALFGARGNSGVILSRFFAGVGESLADKESVSAAELAAAFSSGVGRAYAAVEKPVEGTMLTVFRESAQFASDNLSEESSIESFLMLIIDEAKRSLLRTKEILPALIEAGVVDSGAAGYLAIVNGMYSALTSTEIEIDYTAPQESAATVNYDLFGADSELEFGYCTECLVRLQNAKVDPSKFDVSRLSLELEAAGCDSVVLAKEGDVLKLHAHSKTPAVILTLAQQYGEFLNVKIENMSLQHSEREAAAPKAKHKRYGIVTVASGDGMSELFRSLGADVVINGGQTGNPAAEEFLKAFAELEVDHIIVLPNNKNILLTAKQAAELSGRESVSVIPTKSFPEGYAALAVFNSSVEELDEQISDMTDAKNAVSTIEITEAVRDTVIDGISVKEGETLGILDGKIVCSTDTVEDAVIASVQSVCDLDEKELLTVFVGAGVAEEERAAITELIEDRFEDLSVEVFIGNQEVYKYVISIE